MSKPFCLILLLTVLVSACSAPAPLTTSLSPVQPSDQPTATIVEPATTKGIVIPFAPTASPASEGRLDTPVWSPTSASTLTSLPSATPTFAPKSWRELPVIPVSVSEQMRRVYEQGLELGNDPRAFSKVGDCQTTLPMFLGDLDKGNYDLGEYIYLQPVIDQFSGSFGRNSRSVKDGLTASAVNVDLWNNWRDCEVSETPLACEYRLHNPSFVIISLGTNDANGLLPFEDTLRKVIDITLAEGIVPILVTKADNAEGDHSINQTIARLAYEYQIPVWNFWLAVQGLPLKGLRSPEHLTYGEYVLPTDFSSPEVLQYAFNVRNLSALQVLDVVWRSVTGQTTSH
jgi:hypothetical protein